MNPFALKMAATITGNRLAPSIFSLLQAYGVCRGATVLQWPVRHKHKVNIKHPWPGSKERQILDAVTKPIYPVITPDPLLTCTRRSDLPDPNDVLAPYDKFLIKHQKQMISKNAQGVIAFCHQRSCSAKVFRKNLVSLKKKGLDIHRADVKVFHHSVKGTKYDVLEMLLDDHTVIITRPEPKVAELITYLKKIPELTLLGALVQDQLLSKTQVEMHAELPEKEVLLAQTCAILNAPAQRLSAAMTSQQEELIRSLQSHADSS